jgi:asparagine N-glycosylation enzyme membrane subunit Stt3
VPELRAGLEPALGFLAQADEVGAVTGEQNALFGSSSGGPGANPVRSWGWLVYTIPFVPAAVFALTRTPGTGKWTPASALFLGLWGLFFALLTLGQRRYGNDFAPAFALLFGIVAWRGVAGLSARIPGARLRAAVRGMGVAVLLIGLLWPVVYGIYGPRARSSLAALERGLVPSPAVTRSIAATLHDFMAEVRRLTPTTSGYLAPGPGPAYGVIAHANLGHAIQYGARRATATDPFWWYIGPDNWDASFAFLAARTEAPALRWAEVLRGRYVITTSEEDPRSVAGQLHARDGGAVGGRPALTRFRLIAESPAGGRGIGEMFRPGGVGGGPAYKLFEIVPGARVVVEAPPGRDVEVSLELRSSQGRPFRYRTVSQADAGGEAVLRLPYPTAAPTPPDGSRRTEAVGVYRIQWTGQTQTLGVSEEAVLSGAELRVPGR